jgi:hypothetical protein
LVSSACERGNRARRGVQSIRISVIDGTDGTYCTVATPGLSAPSIGPRDANFLTNLAAAQFELDRICRGESCEKRNVFAFVCQRESQNTCFST